MLKYLAAQVSFPFSLYFLYVNRVLSFKTNLERFSGRKMGSAIIYKLFIAENINGVIVILCSG